MEVIRHKGVGIIFFDYRGLDDTALVDQIKTNVEQVEALVQKGERNLLRLTDVTGTYASDDIIDAFKRAAVRLKPHFKASAVVGIKGGKKFLLDLVSRFAGIGIRPFDDVEEAKDWLVEQAIK
jgi:hypothetical protein